MNKIGPVAEPDRIVSLDVLRGFAVLGILVMNIQSFSMIGAAYFFPVSWGDFSGVNYLVWALSHVFFNSKFITIFSMLFGVGIVLMAERAEKAGRRPAGLHYRRMGVLLLFGLAHGYLLWIGDVLFSYAMCGLLVYLFRRVRPSRLIVLGLITVAVGWSLSCFFGWSTPYWPEAQLEEFVRDWRPTAEMAQEEIDAMRGSWSTIFTHQAPMTFFMQTFLFLGWVSWKSGGAMLLGMALYKLGWLAGDRSRRFYATMAVVGFALSLPLVILGMVRIAAADWEPVYTFFVATNYNAVGRLFMAMGWIGLFLLAYKSSSWRPLTTRLAAVGRMALSNYLGHTLICTFLCYGWGLGQFCRLSRIEQAGVVVAIWILQMYLSPLWLERFRFGPAEWVWRSLSYWQRQPMRRGR